VAHPTSPGEAHPLDPAGIAHRQFASARRGFDSGEVRVYLQHLATAVAALQAREAELLARAQKAEARAHDAERLDEHRLVELLGEETARVLAASRDAAADIKQKAQEAAARLISEANDHAHQVRAEGETAIAAQRVEMLAEVEELRREAASELDRRRAEGRETLAEMLREATAQAESLRHAGDQARQKAMDDAEVIRAEAEEEGRRLVAEAQVVRERMLRDLARRRRAAREQLERLHAARDRLLAAYEVVRRTVAEATTELQVALPEAKIAGDQAMRRVLAEPEPTVEDLEAEVSMARIAGLLDPLPPVGEARHREPEPAGPGPEPGLLTGDAGDIAAAGGSEPELLTGDASDVWAEARRREPELLTGDAGDVGATGVAAEPRWSGGPEAQQRTGDASDVRAADWPEPDPELLTGDAGHAGEVGASAEPREPDEPEEISLEPALTPEVGPPATHPLDVPAVLTGDDDLSVRPAAEPERWEEPEPEPEPLEDAEPPGPDLDELFARLRQGRDQPADVDVGPEPGPPINGVSPLGGQGGETAEQALVGATASADMDRRPAEAGEAVEIQPDDRPWPTSVTVQAATPAESMLPSNGRAVAPTATASARQVDEVEAATGPPEGADDTDGDTVVLRRRDETLTAIERDMGRLLKRALADEQNEVLDLLRRTKPTGVDDLLPAAEDHAERYADAARDELDAAANWGAIHVAEAEEPPPPAETGCEALAADLGRAVVQPLRERIGRSFVETGGDLTEVTDRLRALYREWKGQRIAEAVRHFTVAAYTQGAYAALPDGTPLRWLVDRSGAPCPDADDNALAGRVRKGDAFPTGDHCPPAHPGCRCLVIRETS
jgi:hypothetical protein